MVVVEFSVLGRLDVSLNDERLDVGASKQRTVLAALLIRRNEALSIDRLMESVWWNPPSAASSNLRMYMSGLRRVLQSGEGGSRLQTVRAGGYQLCVLPGELDLDRFDGLVEQGERALQAARLPAAAHYFEAALRVWRGRALDGVAGGPALHAQVTLLDERRVGIAERWAKLRLDLRQPQEIVAELRALAAEHPLRERLWGHLMLALCRCGRPGEALAAYAQLRTTLAGELGADPGPEVQQLYGQILHGDGRLAPGGVESGGERIRVVITGTSTQAPPRQLPATATRLCGRAVELARLQQVLSRTGGRRGSAVVAIDGLAGVGKSALALDAAHANVDRFPDGQFYVNLGGTTAGMKPLQPVDVLGRFLRTLGVPASAVPANEAEAATLFRSLVANRRFLVVLDDAASIAQVRPLLPGGAPSAAIVTSRGTLTGLAEAVHVSVSPLSPTSAVVLLSQQAGSGMVAADPGAAIRLATLCGRLPLALRIAAARLAARPGWSIASLVARLEEAQYRLDELAIDGLAVRASIEPSYLGLTDESKLALRRLGLLQATQFPPWALAALLDTPLGHAEQLLDGLVAVRLAEPISASEDRYRLPDLIHLYAQEQAASADRPEARKAASLRLVSGCLALAEHANSHLFKDSPAASRHTLVRWSLPTKDMDKMTADPQAWFDREQDFLMGVVRCGLGLAATELAGSLAASLTTFFRTSRHHRDWRRLQMTVLQAALRTGDHQTAAIHRRDLANSKRKLA